MAAPTPVAKSGTVSKTVFWIVSIVLLLIAAVGVGLYANANMNPHVVTAVSTAYATNTAFVTNTQTATSYSTLTSIATATVSSGYSANCFNGYGCQSPCGYGNSNMCQVTVTPSCYNNNYYNSNCNNSNYYNNYYSQPYNGYYYNYPYYNSGYSSPNYNSGICQSQNSTSNTVKCSGYLHLDTNGCVELAIPFLAPWLETQAYQYYTLNNLPSSYPPAGSWVTVTGQVHQGYYAGSYPYGSVCPGNSIDVATIS